MFKILHEGNGNKDNKLKKSWGRLIPNKVANSINDKKLSKEVLDLFEQVFLVTVGRIIKPDTGSLLKIRHMGSGANTLEKA